IDPNPLATIIVPSVAINEGSLNLATSTPLINPNNVPIPIIAINVSHIGIPKLYKTPPIIAAHIITVPIDKSIPPVIMTKVTPRSEEHTSELQSRFDLVCRLLLEKKKKEK